MTEKKQQGIFFPLTLVLLPSQRISCKTKQGHALHSHSCVTSERKKGNISESGKDGEGNKTPKPKGLARAPAGCEPKPFLIAPSSFLIRRLKDYFFSGSSSFLGASFLYFRENAAEE